MAAPRRLRPSLAVGASVALAAAAAAAAVTAPTPAAAQAADGGGNPVVASFATLLDRTRCEALAPLRAALVPTAGSTATGYVLLSPVWVPTAAAAAAAGGGSCGTTIKAEVRGLPTPGAAHGFHIHEFGDTTAEDGTSAGGHYNPGGVDHALPDDAVRHMGDMGNVEAGGDGTAVYEEVSEVISLPAVVGRSVVVHADPDDGGQPTGNAGARLAQGVLGYMKTE